MASRGYPYTLAGFSEEVDRRPLFFVLPLPATRVCNACGLVPHVKALLPCEHSFCKPCYKQCEAEGVVACPLDADACSAEEVTWVNHPARSILAKQVLCWNQASGCNVTTAAADLPRHFFHECAHHVARCPKCDMDTLASNVCAHLQSHFGPSSAPRAATDHRTQTVPEEREPLPMTSPEAANGSSTALSANQDQLKEIIDALKIIAAAPTAGNGGTDAGNWEARLLQETLSQMRIQIGKLKDQLMSSSRTSMLINRLSITALWKETRLSSSV
ncbi:hypothetical protein HPB48_021396 [Haemaphysalis longicornis]|uniref:RING-type domain-containing protein n=1 Tax=Haemaphysalis longicornis TaxID=44386 RepID=A0A9J6FPB7_HAELO|nr:hypothetical protein HPB48_021396 [Haemaphysalis longicornis]